MVRKELFHKAQALQAQRDQLKGKTDFIKNLGVGKLQLK